eukprot:5779862-Alexandrium_andersonii.AAC.1
MPGRRAPQLQAGDAIREKLGLTLRCGLRVWLSLAKSQRPPSKSSGKLEAQLAHVSKGRP